MSSREEAQRVSLSLHIRYQVCVQAHDLSPMMLSWVTRQGEGSVLMMSPLGGDPSSFFPLALFPSRSLCAPLLNEWK